MRNPLFYWLFYGHFWIALAAMALSWQSTYLHGANRAVTVTHWLTFFATLGVYTSHRTLSYRRAKGEPDGRRYHLVANRPVASALVALISLTVAAALATQFPLTAFWPVVFAVPLTLFYLIPLYPSGPRLRDLPYLKVVWVALAWTLVTDVFATGAFTVESILRFAFTLAVALLFDIRDVALDRRQGVRTLAAAAPRWNRRLAIGLPLGCALSSPLTLAVAYLISAGIGLLTTPQRSEHYYAVWVNGCLLLPPLLLLLD